MDIQTIIDNWIAAGNAYDTEKYLRFYAEDAVLDDPSIGRKFRGHKGINEYFDSYFIGYKTQTKLVRIDMADAENVHVEVHFTGDFPEGEIGGTFDLTFKDGKITFATADLI
jgi:ketosteroid isomerase-like protein